MFHEPAAVCKHHGLPSGNISPLILLMTTKKEVFGILYEHSWQFQEGHTSGLWPIPGNVQLKKAAK